jgi:hypothetical protein
LLSMLHSCQLSWNIVAQPPLPMAVPAISHYVQGSFTADRHTAGRTWLYVTIKHFRLPTALFLPHLHIQGPLQHAQWATNIMLNTTTSNGNNRYPGTLWSRAAFVPYTETILVKYDVRCTTFGFTNSTIHVWGCITGGRSKIAHQCQQGLIVRQTQAFMHCVAMQACGYEAD